VGEKVTRQSVSLSVVWSKDLRQRERSERFSSLEGLAEISAANSPWAVRNDISAKALKVLAQKVASRAPGATRNGVGQSHCRTLVLAGRDLDQHVGRVVQVHLKDARLWVVEAGRRNNGIVRKAAGGRRDKVAP